MSFYATPQIKLLFQKMKHTQARLSTAADNLSRSEIPGQKPKKVESFEKAVQRNRQPKAISTTQPGHISGSQRASDFSIMTSKSKHEKSLLGNQINSDVQLLELNETTTDFHKYRQVNSNMMARIRLIASLGSGK